jgi:cysteine desulfurase family protein
MLYLDNAATSFPKAPGVVEAMGHYLRKVGASAGRGGHQLTREADALLWETRTLVAGLLGAEDPRRVVFCLNVTQALNMALLGILREKDHVVTTTMEHNSVMRPLRHLERGRGVRVTVVPCSREGLLDPQDLLSKVTSQTRLIVMTHASNVTGGMMPVAEVGSGKGDALLLVDAAQTAGAFPIDMRSMGIDMVAFTGHKSLLGPPGIGGLCLNSDTEVSPLVRGGTGTASESHEHPKELPLALEAGTQNMAGVAGLRAALLYILDKGVDVIRGEELQLTRHLLEGLRGLEGLEVYGPAEATLRLPVVSVNMAGVHPDHLATILEEGYGLLVRSGLHCAPSAHSTLGTFPEGTLRISPGLFQSLDDIEQVCGALREISGQSLK